MIRSLRVFFCLAAIFAVLFSCAFALTRCPELDAALSMLEEGNPFPAAYNALTGAQVIPADPKGCPYFFGGSNASLIGRTVQSWASSTYYKEGQWYPGGLDCVGFTRWVFSQSGREAHPAISSMLAKRCKPYEVPMSKGQPAALLQEVLEVGDLLAIKHAGGGYHVVMYIGTLRGFGFTGQDAGEALAPALDYPLVIHCSSNRDYSQRYALWIRENGLAANTTDGGVMVSLFGFPGEGGGEMHNLDKSVLPYYDFYGYHLTVCTLKEGDISRWIRWR